MKLRSSYLVILAVTLLAGCASAPVVAPELRFVDRPALNTTSTAELGDTLLVKEKAYVFDGLELQERITDNGIAREYIVEPGRMRLIRKDPDGTSYFSPTDGAYYVNDKTFRRRAVPSNGLLVLKENGAIELQGYYDLTGPGQVYPPNPKYTVGKMADISRPNFRQQLIYGGRSGDQIKVTYREFSGDFARPAFAQDVQYDLGADKLIGFKGVRIEIVEATNTKLTYRVLKSFPDAD